jgi:excisionase family DNA binding protein
MYRIANIAKLLGVPRQTVQTAVDRGDIPSETTACGLPLVKRQAVERFLAHRPKRGPKPKHT